MFVGDPFAEYWCIDFGLLNFIDKQCCGHLRVSDTLLPFKLLENAKDKLHPPNLGVGLADIFAPKFAGYGFSGKAGSPFCLVLGKMQIGGNSIFRANVVYKIEENWHE